MPRKQRPGKFVIKYNRRDGYTSDVRGELEFKKLVMSEDARRTRAERLLDMITVAVTFGEMHVPGFSDVLDQYIKDYDARVAETEANGGKVPT
jgi:hypothetical protein